MSRRIAALGLGVALMMGPMVLAPATARAADNAGSAETSVAPQPYCPYPIVELANGGDCKGEYGGANLQ